MRILFEETDTWNKLRFIAIEWDSLCLKMAHLLWVDFYDLSIDWTFVLVLIRAIAVARTSR